jgi:nucleoside-diphosphate-sugar epimerase
VVGANHQVGGTLLRALVAQSRLGSSATAGPGDRRIRNVIGIDTEPGAVEGVDWRSADPADPGLAASLAGVDVAVFVAANADLATALAEGARSRRERCLRRAQTAITAAAAAGVSQLVVVTSAMVYGALPDNPVPIPEGAPLRAPADEGLVGDLMDIEQLISVARDVHRGLSITAVRPAALVGSGVDTVITRHFEAPRLLAIRGIDPAWQFCHIDDLAAAVAMVVVRRLGPVVTVGSPGTLSQAQVERLTGMRRVELSESAALGTAHRLHRVGVLPTPATDLAYAVHPWVIGSETLRAAGWEPAYDNETCLGVLLDGVRGAHAVAARRLDRKDAALGAASAAVAFVGTAAIMRRRRRKGGGA